MPPRAETLTNRLGETAVGTAWPSYRWPCWVPESAALATSTGLGTSGLMGSMRVLLTEGSGLTSRQVAQILGAAGHTVGVVSSERIALTRFAPRVRGWHRVPPFGPDPIGWLSATLQVACEQRYDVLLPTQEQVAAVSWALRDDAARAAWPSGLATVVPPFEALRRVQDKASATATLEAYDVPQPPTAVTRDGAPPPGWDRFPAYCKHPIGTASTAVTRVDDADELAAAVAAMAGDDPAKPDPVVVQAAVDGPLVMATAVFDGGRLVAFHACRRVREGSGGGASLKVGLAAPELRAHLARLGAGLGWHGALSVDVVDDRVIDVNPRLVEPANALASGVDLVAVMLALADGEHPEEAAPGRDGVRTHQLLLAVLGAAQRGRGRMGVAVELTRATWHRGPYRGSHEELTPVAAGPYATLPLLAASAVTGMHPASYRRFTTTSVDGYALTPQGWAALTGGTPDRSGR